MRKILIVLLFIMAPLFMRSQTLVERCSFNQAFIFTDVFNGYIEDSADVDVTMEIYRDKNAPFIVVINNQFKERDTFFITEVRKPTLADTIMIFSYISKRKDEDYLLTLLYDQSYNCLTLGLSNIERMIIFAHKEEPLKPKKY